MNVPLTPRLLSAQAAAEYLSLPVATVKRLAIGRRLIGSHVRYDRFAIDAYLDGDSAGAPTTVSGDAANMNDEAEAALARFTSRQTDAPRGAPGPKTAD